MLDIILEAPVKGWTKGGESETPEVRTPTVLHCTPTVLPLYPTVRWRKCKITVKLFF
jgi:hypothetical protein